MLLIAWALPGESNQQNSELSFRLRSESSLISICRSPVVCNTENTGWMFGGGQNCWPFLAYKPANGTWNRTGYHDFVHVWLQQISGLFWCWKSNMWRRWWFVFKLILLTEMLMHIFKCPYWWECMPKIIYFDFCILSLNVQHWPSTQSYLLT